MEKIIDDLDCRKRAEEIYSRRNGIKIETQKNIYVSIYKFLFQLLVLVNLAIIFVLYSNRDFIFSKDFLTEVNNFYNINIGEKIESFFELDENTELNQSENECVQQNQQTLNTVEENEVQKEAKLEDIIKESYSFINPVEGTITSFFGNRESSNPNVSGFHTGIDIGAVKGSEIKSSISGKVTQVSNAGGYGKHLKVQNNEIITLYAHCNDIFVNEGDDVMQGQKIAEVGSTGNSTGPHLHFEIRYNDEYIDPLSILIY